MERQGAFDYILLETSGLADPGNIAPLFWVDEGLGSTIYLDGIVTVVDAKNIVRNLDDSGGLGSTADAGEPNVTHDETLTIAHVQISHADIILLNKVDTVMTRDLDDTKDRIRSINSLAKIEETKYSQLTKLEGVVLDLHAYDNLGQLQTSHCGHSHLDPVCNPVLGRCQVRT